jgi:glycogen(starch) synthase
MVPEKGFDLVLRAFAQVAPHFPEAVLTMASDGVERENLRRLGETLGLGDRVTFPGWIAEEDMPALINDHSLVMVPSRHEEPFGLVALQAAQMGRPVIAARSGGLAEIVLPGATGLLFESDNADSLADALAVLLRDPEMMTRMGIAARDHAIRHYDYGAFVSAYEELYGEALRRKKQSQTAVAA